MHVSRHVLVAFAATALVATPSATAAAQQVSPAVHFGLASGLNIPLSDLSQNAQVGYALGGMAEGTPIGWPVALRGELSYASFAGKHHYVSQSVTTVSVNAVLPLTPAAETPYFIGGIGLNHLSSFASYVSENDAGFNFGGGYKWQLAEMSTFVEIRYVYIAHTNASRQMLPITFGVLF